MFGIRFPRKIGRNLNILPGLGLAHILPLGLGGIFALAAALSRFPLLAKAPLALASLALGFLLAFGRKDGKPIWLYALAWLRFSQKERVRVWGRHRSATPAAPLLLLVVLILLAANIWQFLHRGAHATVEQAGSPMIAVQNTPGSTPTATPGPTPTSTEIYFFDDFGDGVLLGWGMSVDSNSPAWIIESGGLASLGFDDWEKPAEGYFPILYRNDLFPPDGDFEIDFAFRYDRLRQNGVDIGISSRPEAGHYYWDEATLREREPWNLDILDIHQVYTPDRLPVSRRRFRIKLLRGPGQLLWEGQKLPDTGWHAIRLLCQENTPPGSYIYTLYVDETLVGRVTSTLRPASFHAGHKIGKWGGAWSWVSLDYIRVRRLP